LLELQKTWWENLEKIRKDHEEEKKMAKRSKRYRALLEKVDKNKLYGLREAVALAKELATAKFDESLEMHVRLGVDPRHADQQVRSTVVLPHGTGITKRVVVIASGEKIKEAQEAGADFVGGDDIVQKIEGGWLDFEAVIATPDMMKSVGKLGRILGPRGMMPSAKAGTVTFDLATAVKEIKAGKVEFRVDKFGIVHNAFGKASFDEEKLYENAKALFGAILKAKPAAAKGQYVKSLAIAPTMGVGVKVDAAAAQKEIAK
jgi:large subunit ribosomal protein L1